MQTQGNASGFFILELLIYIFLSATLSALLMISCVRCYRLVWHAQEAICFFIRTQATIDLMARDIQMASQSWESWKVANPSTLIWTRNAVDYGWQVRPGKGDTVIVEAITGIYHVSSQRWHPAHKGFSVSSLKKVQFHPIIVQDPVKKVGAVEIICEGNRPGHMLHRFVAVRNN